METVHACLPQDIDVLISEEWEAVRKTTASLDECAALERDILSQLDAVTSQLAFMESLAHLQTAVSAPRDEWTAEVDAVVAKTQAHTAKIEQTIKQKTAVVNEMIAAFNKQTEQHTAQAVEQMNELHELFEQATQAAQLSFQVCCPREFHQKSLVSRVRRAGRFPQTH